MRLKIKTERGCFYFLYARKLWEFGSLSNAMNAANSLMWHNIQLRLNAYTDSGIVLHA